MKKKLLLINPKNPSKAHFQNDRTAAYQPLGLGIIAALTPGDWEVEILDEYFEKFSYREADLVGVTAFTPSANRAYSFASFYRKQGIPTVMGGIHASMMPEEALNYVNTVVTGEAESVWEKVIGDFESGSMQKIYRGELLPMEGAPHPRRELFNSRYLLGSIQTTRGCPMHCDFCSVSAFNGRQYRKRPVKEVLDELENIPQKRVLFVDDNLTGNGKEDEERSISLFKGMIERKLNKEWFCQTSINVASNEEVLYYASKSGCRMMLIGVESEKEAVLANLNKKANLNILNRYDEIFRLINKYKIATIGGFIFGTDLDTADDLRCRAQYINQSRVDIVQATVLTPLPGTKLYQKFRDSGRLLYTDYPEDWEKYDMLDVLFKPALMEHEDLKEVMIECLMSFSNLWNVFKKFIRTLVFTKNLWTALWALNGNRVYRSMMLNKIKEWKQNKN